MTLSSKNANILFVDHTITPSGAAISFGTLIRHLNQRFSRHFILRKRSKVGSILGAEGCPCHVEHWMPDFPTTPTPHKYSLPLWLWHFFKLPVAFLELVNLRRRWKINLLHANETCLVGYVFMARLLGIPVVLHARGPLTDQMLPRSLLLMAARYPKLRVIAIDDETFNSFPAALRTRTTVIYNPIVMAPPTTEDAAALRKKWGLGAGDIAIGQVARLHDVKGIWTIMELAARVCPGNPNIKFVFVGDDREDVGDGPKLKAFAKAHGLEQSIIFAGYVPQVACVYEALDIALCLFANILKGVGRTVYEAAMVGCPMLLTLENGAQSPTLMQGALGVVCPPNDFSALEQELRRLVGDADLRHALGLKAREAIGSRHDPHVVARRVEEVYDGLLGS